MRTAIVRSIICVAAAGVAIATIGPAATAATPDAPSAALSARSTGVVPVVDSTYLAGYTKSSEEVTRARAKFRFPFIDCPSEDFQGIKVGIGNEEVEGSPTVQAVVIFGCLGGSQYYQMEARAGETVTGSAIVFPGHKIIVSIDQSATSVTATVTDKEFENTIVATGAPTPDNTITYGAFPHFAGSNKLAVPDFDNVKFKKSRFNGSRLTDATRVHRVNDGLEIKAGRLRDGRFPLKFVSN